MLVYYLFWITLFSIFTVLKVKLLSKSSFAKFNYILQDKIVNSGINPFYTTIPPYFKEYFKKYNSYIKKNRIVYFSPHRGAGLGNRLGGISYFYNIFNAYRKSTNNN